jgi:hypothetical protein
MNESDSTILRGDPQRLARLLDSVLGDDAFFKLGQVRMELWRPEDFGEVLRHKLSESFPIDAADLASIRAAKLREALQAAAHDVSSLAALFQCPTPPVALLEWAKDYARALRDAPESPLPPEVAAVLYYASVAVALVRCGKRITPVDDASLRQGFEWVLTQPWVDEPLKELIGLAQRELSQSRGAAPLLTAAQSRPLPLASAPKPPFLAQTHRYHISGSVGRGGMGQVLRAHDWQTGRTVAMKVMLPNATPSPESVRRFLREARVLGQLEHPNIVPMHELGVDDEGRAYYTMKLVQGTTLHEVLRKIKEGDAATVARFPLAQLLTVFQKVCDAVAFAHARNVVHRDLNPKNIMLGGFGEVWLATDAMNKWRAVKVVYRHEASGADRGYEREFKAIQRYEEISHQHGSLMPILSVGRDPADRFFYYSMELADDVAATVRSRVEPLGSLEAEEKSARDLTLQLQVTSRGRFAPNCDDAGGCLRRSVSPTPSRWRRPWSNCTPMA